MADAEGELEEVMEGNRAGADAFVPVQGRYIIIARVITEYE